MSPRQAAECHVGTRDDGVTVSAWWPEILAFLDTGITNAGSEGTNRVIKTVARDAYGFHPVSQRLRTRCATTRRGRGFLDPANFEESSWVSMRTVSW